MQQRIVGACIRDSSWWNERDTRDRADAADARDARKTWETWETWEIRDTLHSIQYLLTLRHRIPNRHKISC
jgi:hypothetical protein